MIENNQLIKSPVHIGSRWKPGQVERRTETSYEMVNSTISTQTEVMVQLALIGPGVISYF